MAVKQEQKMNRNILNKGFLSVSLLTIALLFSSCEDWLREKTYDFISEVEDSDSGADQLVLGTYSYLLDDMFRWNQFPKVLDMDCDYASGPDWSLSQIGAGNFQGDQGMDPVWKKSYTLIHRANNAIELISKMNNVTEAHKLNTIGEMKFIKAWGYFLLVRAYGDVPIYKQSVNTGVDFNQPRKPIKEVWEYIIELLQDAERDMYKNTDPQFQEGRASAGAAASLLAKSYLTIASASMPSGNITVKGGIPYEDRGEVRYYTNPVSMVFEKDQVAGYEEFDSQAFYKLARDKAKQVMDQEYGNYGFLSFDQLWALAYQNKTEHIWSIQARSGDVKYGSGVSMYYTGTEDGSGVIITGLWHGCRDHWYKLFERNDLRIVDGVMHRWLHNMHMSWNGGAFYPNNDEYSIRARGYYVSGNDTIYNDPVTGNPFEKSPEYNDGRNYVCDQTSDYLAFLTKYYDVSDRTQEKTDAAWPVLRYADVVLMFAEAENEVSGGGSNEALNALNEVRLRSRASAKTFTGEASIASVDAFRSAVIEERAMELALEGDRRWDLIRWGIYLQVMNSIGGNDEVGVRKVREPKHLLYPIPVDEVLTNGAINRNNPGWD